MTDSNPILVKVRKLLAKAEDAAATAAEAEAFTAKATQLITAYGIDQALLAQDRTEHTTITDRVIEFSAPYAKDKAALCFGIASNLRCKAVQRQRGPEISLHLFGPESDLASVEILVTSLLLQGTRDLTRTPIPPYEHPAAYRRSWWNGFAVAVAHRMAQEREKSVRTAEQAHRHGGPSVALVLADRAHEAELAVRLAYPHLGTMRPRRLSGGGSRAGYASGQRARLGTEGSLADDSRRQLRG